MSVESLGRAPPPANPALVETFDPIARAAPDAEGITSPATQAFRAERAALVGWLLARGVAVEDIEVTLTREPERTVLRVRAVAPESGPAVGAEGGHAEAPAAAAPPPRRVPAPGDLHRNVMPGDL